MTKHREIQRIINAEDEVRLSPYKDNKLIKHELIKFKANVFWLFADSTSPLAVSTYSFGFPKTKVLAQFVNSKAFFLSPEKRGCLKSMTFLNTLNINGNFKWFTG